MNLTAVDHFWYICLLGLLASLFGSESFVFQFAIQKFKDQDI
jgi:hypothetical protein